MRGTGDFPGDNFDRVHIAAVEVSKDEPSSCHGIWADITGFWDNCAAHVEIKHNVLTSFFQRDFAQVVLKSRNADWALSLLRLIAGTLLEGNSFHYFTTPSLRS